MSSSPEVIRLPMASAVEKTTPIIVSVASRVLFSIAPDQQRPHQERGDATRIG